MGWLKKIWARSFSTKKEPTIIQTSAVYPIESFDAKQKQLIFVKESLKPILKKNGYLTQGQTWWKEERDLVIIINLQNFSWNSKSNVNFCFNIGMALKATIKHGTKPSIHDVIVQGREGTYLSEGVQLSNYRNHSGYEITTDTDLADFTNAVIFDFERSILPCLSKLNTKMAWTEYFESTPFWGDRLKKMLTEVQKP